MTFSRIVALSPAAQLGWLYATYFWSHGVAVPYLPVAMKRMGADGVQIGQAMAAALVISVVTPPLWGLAADRMGGAGPLIPLCAVGAALGMLGAALGGTSTTFIIGFLMFVVAKAPVSTLLDALTLRLPEVGAARYGTVRRWGSLGFALAAGGVGLIVDRISPQSILILIGGAWIGVAMLALAFGYHRQGLGSPRPLPLSRLYGNRGLWGFLALSAFHASAHIPFETYFANYASERGLPGSWVGGSWFAGVTVEVFVLGSLAGFLSRFGPRRVLLAAYTVGLVRWSATAYFDGGFPMAAVQLLHGISFGAFFGASVSWMYRITPPDLRASGQAIFGSVVWGVGGVIAQLGFGKLSTLASGRWLFVVAAALELVPLVAMALMVEPPEDIEIRETSRSNEAD